MKNTIILRSNEVSAINDVLGTYGSEKRVNQISRVIYGISVSGIFTKDHTYILTVEIPMLFGLCKIAMDHAHAVKGLVKALNGIIDTINYLGKNISRDIKNLFQEYEEKK